MTLLSHGSRVSKVDGTNKMSTILVLKLAVLHSFLFLLAVRENKAAGRPMSPYEEPIGRLGPTIVEKPYKVSDDVDTFKKHIDEKNLDPIVELIADRTLTQRLAIAAAYQKKFPKTNVTLDINSILDKKKDGPKDLFKGFFIALPEYLARHIQASLDLKHHWLYMSIICTSSATKMKAVVIAYSRIYMKALRDELDNQLNDSEGKDVLKQMVDPRYVRPDYGCDSTIVDQQLNIIPSDKVSYASDPYEYFAEEYDLGMEDNDLYKNAHRYVITTRNEIDLKDIMDAYKNKYSKDTIDVIMKKWHDTEYRKLFIAVLKGNN